MIMPNYRSKSWCLFIHIIFLMNLFVCSAIAADAPTYLQAIELQIGTPHSDYLDTFGEQYWVKFNLPVAGEINVLVEVPSGHDYDIIFYNSAASYLGGSFNDGLGDDELINYSAPSPGWYYVCIYGYNGDYSATEPFTTTVSYVGGDDTYDGAENIDLDVRTHGLISHTGDVDWVKFYVPSQGVISVLFEVPSGNNFDIELYDNISPLVVLDLSENGIGIDETIDYTVTHGGWYYLRQYGNTGDYNESEDYFTTVSFSPTPPEPETFKFERMWPSLQQPLYFGKPNDLDIDNDSFIYVVDEDSHNVRKFTADGYFVTSWGKYGAGDGEFNNPVAVAIGPDGFIYIADYYNHRIQKFTTDGEFIITWGSYGTETEQFRYPTDVTIDKSGFVYVADYFNDRIQKFTADGQFVTSWSSSCIGVVADNNGFIFVADNVGDCIRKYDDQGNLQFSWGGYGTADNQFINPRRIAIDNNGFVYVAEPGDDTVTWIDGLPVYLPIVSNARVQKFTSNGIWVKTWGEEGNGNGEFNLLKGIAVDKENCIYTLEWQGKRIQKFNDEGEFLIKWGSDGDGPGQFYYPSGSVITEIDGEEFLFVSDQWNNRIQKFTLDGQFKEEWGSFGTGDGEFDRPNGITVDSEGNFYVADTYNHRVQKFDSNYQYLTQWGGYTETEEDGKFCFAVDVALDSNGDVYVTSMADSRVEKFTKKTDGSGDYEWVLTWGGRGPGDGEFVGTCAITVDDNDFVFVTDIFNHRVQKFDINGQFIRKFGSLGSQNGMFQGPIGIVTDSDGNVYVAENINNYIQKFSPVPDGIGGIDYEYAGKVGGSGSSPGKFLTNAYAHKSLTLDSDNKLYVVDSGNNRIQVFEQVTPNYNSKAIILAGGGAFPGNNLWNATQMCANFAYRALIYQGFSKESIYYLSSDSDLDLDGNGELDDVDADATNANLEDAIVNWASGAESLLLYVVDHGGVNSFRMSGTETLSAAELDSWLDTIQGIMAGRVTVVYDACESGTFLPTLTPPSGKERVVISSTSTDESAYFVTQGSISFSSYFWSNIFNGIDVKDSFNLARQALGDSADYQNPMLDADGDGAGNEDPEDFDLVQGTYIGNATLIHGSAPDIGSVSADPQNLVDENASMISAASVTDEDGIARVWAVFRRPDYVPGASGNAVQELPFINLMPVNGSPGLYEATYEEFNVKGDYQIAIYARDMFGNTSIPELVTVTVDNPLRRRAIVVGGGAQADEFWPAAEKNVKMVLDALAFQGYSTDDIDLFSPASIPGVPNLNLLNTLSNLEYAINDLANSGTQDLVLYMIGHGCYASFLLNDTETLFITDLDTWLDNLQATIPGKVTVIYDAGLSGSILPFLTPPVDKERILISSTDKHEAGYSSSDGDVSFSRFFWSRVLNGTNVRDSFSHAKNAILYSCQEQSPQLDDNGNGIGNENPDGILSMNYTIGAGIMLAGDDPLVGDVSPDQALSSGEISATIWAENVTTTGTIDRVWAVIKPAGYDPADACTQITDLPTLPLTDDGSGRYEGLYGDFNTWGVYDISIHAMDTEGNESMPEATTVSQTTGADIYESDNSAEDANVIMIQYSWEYEMYDELTQTHNFHEPGDWDWVKFYAAAGETYTIQTVNLGSNCDTVITLYESDGITEIGTWDDDLNGVNDESFDWPFTEGGVCYIKVRQAIPTVYGDETQYDLKVYTPRGGTPGTIDGFVFNEIYDGIPNALIEIEVTGGTATTLCTTSGSYKTMVPSGTWPINVVASGHTFQPSQEILVLAEAKRTEHLFVTSDDSDGDGLTNAIENIIGADPDDADTDDDGLVDGNAGSEDLNADGVVDPGETSPLNWDTDGDGIFDGTERGLTVPETADTELAAGHFIADANPASISDPSDADSDDDGIADGVEDANQNGMVDPGETDPNNSDSDNDGIQDGTEMGITVEVPDPDGTGACFGTNLSVFIPDADDTTQTDPLNNDTDGDGILDGVEDGNHNGAYEPELEETDPEIQQAAIPTVSEWGMMVLFMLLVGSALLVMRRKRAEIG